MNTYEDFMNTPSVHNKKTWSTTFFNSLEPNTPKAIPALHANSKDIQRLRSAATHRGVLLRVKRTAQGTFAMIDTRS